MLRRVMLLGGMLLVGVIVLGGVALAADIRGTFGQDNLIGTNQLDRIYGLGAADTISGLAGNDDCYGGSGADEISCGSGMDRIDGGFGFDDLFGGPNNDTISAADGFEDNVDCGTGNNDTAYVDNQDIVNNNCENIWRLKHNKPITPSAAQEEEEERIGGSELGVAPWSLHAHVFQRPQHFGLRLWKPHSSSSTITQAVLSASARLSNASSLSFSGLSFTASVMFPFPPFANRPNVWNIRPGGALAGGSCMAYRGRVGRRRRASAAKWSNLGEVHFPRGWVNGPSARTLQDGRAANCCYHLRPWGKQGPGAWQRTDVRR